MHAHSDQAAGLRRLFRRTPPAVFALFATGRSPLKTAARAVRSLTEGGRRVVVLEEHGEATGSLFGSFGTDGGADLLATLERGLDPADTLREAADGLWLVRAAATAQAVPWLDAGHLSRLESAIGELQRRADLLAVHAAGDGAGLTPFAQAAARHGNDKPGKPLKPMSVTGSYTGRVALVFPGLATLADDLCREFIVAGIQATLNYPPGGPPPHLHLLEWQAPSADFD
ncbi:MAG TPA: hypothetical protein PLX21_16975, partial [Rhodocyclaceae bacterium]|nr:hypothetical protein [Rhodocyclaceae bacterium]